MNLERFMLPCFSKTLFGIDCPGCGLQRSMLLLANGDFAKAFHMYPAVFTTVIFFIFVGLHFVDKQRSYHQLMVVSALANASIMIIAYFIKMFQI